MSILDYLYQSPNQEMPKGGLLGVDTRDIGLAAQQIAKPRVGLENIYAQPSPLEAIRGQAALRKATPLVAEGQFGQAAQSIQQDDPEMAMRMAEQSAQQKQFEMQQREKYKRALALAQAQAGMKPKDLGVFEKTAQTKLATKIAEETPKSVERVSSYDRAEQLLDAGLSTGGQYKLPFAETIGSIDPNVSEFRSLSEKLVPTMREPGSGSSSDADIAMFRNATFSLDKPEETNRNIIRGARAAEQNKLAQNEFKAFAINQGMTTTQADQKWKEYLKDNPIFEHQKGKKNVDYELNQNRKTWEEYFTQPGGGVDMQDPRVQEALSQGYSIEEIKKFINK